MGSLVRSCSVPDVLALRSFIARQLGRRLSGFLSLFDAFKALARFSRFYEPTLIVIAEICTSDELCNFPYHIGRFG